jgi:ribonucrease Y
MRDLPFTTYLAALLLVSGLLVWLYWFFSRSRIARDTIGRAQEDAARIRRDAEHDAENARKSAILDGKERAHDLLIDAERQAHERRHELTRAEAKLAEQTRALAERVAAGERIEQDLR